MQAEKVCKAGGRWIQARAKNQTPADWKKIIMGVGEVCKKHNAVFIVNDNVGLAKKCGADGVHLGKTDMFPSKAREFLGNGFIIGGTANTFEDVARLANEKVDYIGLGPYRFTTTKKNLSPVLGLEGYKIIIESMHKANIAIPIIAIGGILPHDIGPLLGLGVHGVALSSVITQSQDMESKTKEILEKFLIEK